VDACKGGWVAVVTEDGRFARSLLAPSLRALLSEIAEASAVGVDMPIGLPLTGHRTADIEARKFVGPRRSSVFPTPPREALLAPSYADARRLVPSLSAQSFALRTKILEVEACLEDRVFEVHPEVSFAALAGRHLPFSSAAGTGRPRGGACSPGQGSSCPTSSKPASRLQTTSSMLPSQRGRPSGRPTAAP
jgi:predicted RNase H-like nuclease